MNRLVEGASNETTVVIQPGDRLDRLLGGLVLATLEEELVGSFSRVELVHRDVGDATLASEEVSTVGEPDFSAVLDHDRVLVVLLKAGVQDVHHLDLVGESYNDVEA